MRLLLRRISLFLFLTLMLSSKGLTQQDLTNEQLIQSLVGPMPLFGEHTINTSEGLVIVNTEPYDYQSEVILEKSANYIRCDAVNGLDILLFLNDRIERCGPRCTKYVQGEPFVFLDIGTESKKPLNVKLHLVASCDNCSEATLQSAVESLILDSYGLALEYSSTALYSVCQDYGNFLLYFHESDSLFTNDLFNRLEVVHDEEYLKIKNATLKQAVGILSNELNVILQFDPDCKYQSRYYKKPFLIKAAGSIEERIEDFEEKNFVNIQRVEGETRSVIVIADSQ